MQRNADLTTMAPKQRILEVASRLFYTQGIHAVGIDRVIAESFVAKATLYAHFRGKDELVAAYLELESDKWLVESTRRLTKLHLDPPAAVTALFEMLFDVSRTPGFRGCPFINAAAEFPDQGPVTEQIALHRLMQRRVFAEALGAKGSSPDLLEPIFALFNGAMITAYLERRPDVIKLASKSALELLARKSDNP